MKKIILPIILICLIFGTNNYEELNDIAIITKIGITKKKDNYTVILQEVNPKKSDDGLDKKYKYYFSKCKKIELCFNKSNEEIPKSLYFNHLENLVINTDTKKFIYKLNINILNDIDNFNVVYTKNNVSKVIKYNNINSIIDKKLVFRDIKKAKLENKSITIPVVKISDKKLILYKYYKLGDKDE